MKHIGDVVSLEWIKAHGVKGYNLRDERPRIFEDEVPRPDCKKLLYLRLRAKRCRTKCRES